MDHPRAIAKEIFLAAIECDDGGREILLGERCGDNDELRSLVDGLLSAHDASETLFGVTSSNATGEFSAGTRIGPYALVEKIGQGGFAVVWRAQQTDPVNRAVALKVLKAGMDTNEVVRRFGAERQALALMDHPCIAKVLDGGATQSGRPWFAMELVDGQPITEYCEEHALDKRARLDLFIDVCRAVQHAHQKGVIHRDLKPSNILVSEIDGRAIPKVIDFGIAKAIERKLTGDSIHTLEGQIIGTPAYMSPEQVNETADIDTRSDVYALGVLLYELLSGTRPFDEDALQAAGFAEILRIIREDEPPRPSARQNTTTHVAPRELRGDLDWIVMRCLEKDRDRRYDSASILANDIERHLAGDPVLAGPPDVRYRVMKFVRRHRVGIGVSASIVALLIVGVIVSLSLMIRAQNAESELGDEVVRKETELAKFQSISGFFQQVLMGVDPAFAQGKDTVLLRRILDRAADRAAEDSRGVEEVEATIRRVIGNAYMSISAEPESEEQLTLALEIRRRVLPADHPDTLQSQYDLGIFHLSNGRTEQAAPLLLDSLEVRRRVLESDSEQILESLGSVAVLHQAQGNLELAESMLRETKATLSATKGEDDPDTIRATNNLAGVLKSQGQLDEAADLFSQTVEKQLKAQGRRHPETLKAFTNLGGILIELGRTEEAAGYLETALELKREVLTDGDRSLLASMNSLARLHQENEHFDAAERQFQEAIEMIERTGTEETPSAVILRFNYAVLLALLDRGAEAEAEYRAMADISREAFGPDSSITITVESALAWQMHLNGRTAEAEPLGRSVLERAKQGLRPDQPELGMHHIRHGIFMLALDQRDDGIAAVKTGLPIVRANNIQIWIDRGEEALISAGVGD